MAMRGAACLVAALLGASQAESAAAAEGANPIRKVVTLMQDMQKEIEAEGKKEKDLYDKFMCFCEGGTAEMQKGIADGNQKTEELKGKLDSETAEKAQLELDVVTHKSEVATATQDLDKATSIRTKASAEYDAVSADYKTNIAAMASAIPALEKGMGGASLVQVPGVGSRLLQMSNNLNIGSDYEREKIASFLQQKGDFVPQSGQIVGILKSMKDEMEASSKKDAETEAEAVEGYEELKASKQQQIAASSEALKVKTSRIGSLAVSVVQTADDIEDTEKEVAETQKFLEGLIEACPSKEKEWAERSKTRSEEVEAISEAINMLNDDDALDVFKKAVPSAFVQEASVQRYGFLQQRTNSRASKVQRVRALLDGVAQNRKHTSRMEIALYMARSKLRMHAPSFGNISGMIDDMVVLETEEQGGDDKQKPWCNGEFQKEDHEENSEKTEIAALEAEMEEEMDNIGGIDEEIKALKDEIDALDKSVAQATELRKEEHAEYQETLGLTHTAVELIAKAKNRLQKFYNPTLHKAPPKKEEEAFFAQLVRRSHVAPPVMPETFGAYEKKGEKSGGVMALMDQISKELEESISDLEYGEKTAQRDYVTLMQDSQETRAQNAKSLTDKEGVKAEVTAKKMMAKEREVGDVKDLGIIAKYVTELHGSCDFILENFDIRKEARVAEIESLKNAKAMLAGAK